MKLCPTGECTGCAACYNSCAFQAIRMVEDELGALKPHIDEDKCKECGKCADVCPVLHLAPKNHPQKCYALYTRNENDRLTCSSGGAATALARNVIRFGGIVYGAAYDENGYLTMKKASVPEDLEQFKGSKYAYAFPTLIYRDVEKDLKKGVKCLFIGTPCQVDGLKHYVGREEKNLITVDLICHGTPPFTYLKQHILSIVGPRKANRAQAHFRGKRNNMLTIVSGKGKTLHTRKDNEDQYYSAFNIGLIQREICYSCPYAQENRVSDITIGDFWRLDKKALNGYKGRVSVALLNTEKGMEFFNEVLSEFIAEERTVEEAVEGNKQLHSPTKKHPQREAFLKAYREKGFAYAVSRTDIASQTKARYIRNKVLWFPRKVKRFLKGKH